MIIEENGAIAGPWVMAPGCVLGILSALAAYRVVRWKWMGVCLTECWNCGYALKGNTSGVCSECGNEFMRRLREGAAAPVRGVGAAITELWPRRHRRTVRLRDASDLAPEALEIAIVIAMGFFLLATLIVLATKMA